MRQKKRAGRTVRIEVDQDGHRVGIILAPYGLVTTDPGYDDEGGDPAELVDSDGMTVIEEIHLLNEELDEAIARRRPQGAEPRPPSADRVDARRELVGYVTTEFDSLLITDPINAKEAVDRWGVNERYIGQMLAIHDDDGELALGAVIAPTELPHWKFAVYSLRDDEGIVVKLEIEPAKMS
jgi:hypothetical protein